MFQEPESIVYQHVSEIGQIAPDQGYGNWVRVGAVISNLLEPPHSGRRKFVVVLRLVDNDNMPEISLGFSNPDEDGLLWQWTLEFEYEVLEKAIRKLPNTVVRQKHCLFAAFVPPLLAPTNNECGGINFVGSSSIGKISPLFLAASVWGGPKANRFPFEFHAISLSHSLSS